MGNEAGVAAFDGHRQERTMARFYFHIRDRTGLIRDETGSEFESLNEAQREAKRLARSVLGDLREVGDSVDSQAIEISDFKGSVLGVVSLRDGFRQ
jgi:hypothetical protein